jgi:hypothetical protein
MGGVRGRFAGTPPTRTSATYSSRVTADSLLNDAGSVLGAEDTVAGTITSGRVVESANPQANIEPRMAVPVLQLVIAGGSAQAGRKKLE